MKLKKVCLVIIGFVFVVGLFIVFHQPVEVNQKIENQNSHSINDIQSVIDNAINDFQNRDGVTLTDIWYNGEDVEGQENALQKNYHSNESIIVYVNFKTGLNAPEAMNKNSKYTHFALMYVKDSNAQWNLVDSGH